jgi:hypothetical protein
MLFWTLIILSTIVVSIGWFFLLTPATMGVGLIGLGCWFAILARIRLERIRLGKIDRSGRDYDYGQ